MTPRDTILRFRMETLLLAILVLSGSLNLWNIWNLGWSNTYYAAAVRSMLENPAAGFFNSFDPAGFITVDKPPVGLWVQAFSAAILGFSGWALIAAGMASSAKAATPNVFQQRKRALPNMAMRYAPLSLSRSFRRQPA